MNETDNAPAYLVMMDGGGDSAPALAYACARARAERGKVALLYVIEPQEIEAWGGVEKVMTDEAFAKARKDMAAREKDIESQSGMEPVAYYRKGERRAELLALIESEPTIAALVMEGRAKDGGSHALLSSLVSDKGLKKLKVPLIVVPDEGRGGETKK